MAAMILEATVYQALGLRKAVRKDPQQFELVLKDLDNKDRGAFVSPRPQRSVSKSLRTRSRIDRWVDRARISGPHYAPAHGLLASSFAFDLSALSRQESMPG
jgi:hypothetical protein